MAECLLPKPERLSAVGSRVAVPPNRLSYTLWFLTVAVDASGHVPDDGVTAELADQVG